jgi:hypothetical protein
LIYLFNAGVRMQIAELRINGFRGVSSAKLRFAAHNVFIGPNRSPQDAEASGKNSASIPRLPSHSGLMRDD